jgi:hypothetical protein
MSPKIRTGCIAKQNGFFSVAIGLALLVIYGGVGAGLQAAHEADSNEDQLPASEQQLSLLDTANQDPGAGRVE